MVVVCEMDIIAASGRRPAQWLENLEWSRSDGKPEKNKKWKIVGTKLRSI